jgi:hypothetical protein
VQTRREAVILMTAIPLLSTDAVAQDAVAQPDRSLAPGTRCRSNTYAWT